MNIFSTGLVWRQRRSPTLRLLMAAIVFGVCSVATIATVSQSLKSALLGASKEFLAADRQLKSPRPIPDSWLEQARVEGLSVAQAVEFSSMLNVDGQFQLVSAKAVDSVYPLKGRLETQQHGVLDIKDTGPTQQDIWLQPRLFSLLGVDIGSQVELGDASFTVDSTLMQEPDVSFQLAGLAPRVMIPLAMLEASNVIQPGSRATWIYFFEGTDTALDRYHKFIASRLDSSQRWLGVKDGRPALAKSLDRAESYLLLGASLSVLLAALAIAISSRQFGREQIPVVAIAKTLGASGSSLIKRYLIELIGLSFVAALVGLLLAGLVANIWLVFLSHYSDAFESFRGSFLSVDAMLLAFLTAFTFVICFCMPQLYYLKTLPPALVLRSNENSVGAGHGLGALSATGGVFALLYLYSGKLTLVLGLLAGVAGLLVLLATVHAAMMAYIMPYLIARLGQGGAVHQALKRLVRSPKQSLIQLCVYSLSVFLFTFLYLARTSLFDDWQAQLPSNTPNHFLVNVAPDSLTEVQRVLRDADVTTAGLYPMVRGRLSHINDVEVKVAVSKEVAALNRELNLTWSSHLPEDNQLISGDWWPEQGAGNDLLGLSRVSIESRLAENLGVEIGDQLRFMIAGEAVNAVIENIRKVQWDSMRPNFYMMFPPGSLERFSATFITSFYLHEQQAEVVNTLAAQFPSISVIELDSLIKKLRVIVSQVADMVEVMVLFVFAATLFVLASLVASSRRERVQEVVLYRTLGAQKSFIQRTQLCEFFVLGFIAGFAAVGFADMALWLVQQELFGTSFNLHLMAWLWVPLCSGAILSAFGVFQTRQIALLSPMQILRAR